jgi:Flp pilus assembly protein TadG
MLINFLREQLTGLSARLRDRVTALLHDEDGASIILIGVAMPAVIGAFGLGIEIGYWRVHQRAMQNSADAAAIAAATNASSGYVAEAKAVAAQYGFQDGAGQVAVSVTNPATAAGCTANCYKVTISDNVPLFLSQVAGYQGSTTVKGQKMSTLSATAVATSTLAYSYCVFALAGSGKQGITSDGSPDANLNGCNTMSNTSATCNGHNLNAAVGDAHGTNNGCGNTSNSNVPTQSDVFASLATNLPANSCSGTYPQEPTKTHDPPLPASNLLYGNLSSNGVKVMCGDQQLTGNVTLNNTLLVIENGQLDTNGFTFSGTNLTLVFSGTNAANYLHAPTGGGTLDIAAPTSGTWSGVAIYQDPGLNKGVDISAAGNSPTWNLSGLVYLPHSSVTLNGAVNKSSAGQACFELVVDNVTINGTGQIFKNDTQCAAAGLNQTKGGSRGMLVN